MISRAETPDAGAQPTVTDPQLVTREALLAKITAQTDALIPDVLGGPRAHEVALTLVQLAAAYAAIVGSENQ
jgi:hypothetical protein